MPGTALRMAASITVAPFSASMVRVSPLWSTKWILAMIARAAGSVRIRSVPSYNGSIQAALAAGTKTFGAVSGRVSLGPAQQRVDRRSDLCHRILELGERPHRIGAVLQRRFQSGGCLGNRKGADGARRTVQRMRKLASLGRQRREYANQAHRLDREHRQHLALEALIAKRHALEMIDIDRAIIGNELRVSQ